MELEMQNRSLNHAEAEIESAHQRYSDLYDHLPIGYITVSSKGQIMQANLTAAGWLRRNRAELAESYFTWFLDAFDAGRFAAHLDACVQSGYEQSLDVTLRLENGVLLTVNLTSRIALRPEEEDPQIHTAITNISKLKQAHALSKDIGLEADSLTQSIGHELQAPLVTISKLAQTLLHDHAADLTPGTKEIVERMECAAVRMEATLQHLLEYSCTGLEEISLDPVNLDELMQHVLLEQRRVIERLGAEVTVARPLPSVRGARLLLGQVMANVMKNMLKHSASAQNPRIQVSAERNEGEIILTLAEISASDGAAEGDRTFRVFERLHQKHCCWGNGVTLAIIRRTIERMNGRVWVDSQLGKHTRFNIALPAA